MLERNGTTYTFKADIFGTITVQKSGITIDGAGYTLLGRKADNERGISLVGNDETNAAYSNVLIKNLRISNFWTGVISLSSNNNSFIGNYFEAGLHLIGGNLIGNIIRQNVFSHTSIFVDYSRGGLDVITENNFIDSIILVDLSTPPIVDKNYWSNYTAEYPDAKELDNSGIWDTPNVYDKFVGGSHGDYSCIDYHPLVNPITDFEISAFTNPIPTPSLYNPSPTPNLSTQTISPALLWAIPLVLIALSFAVALILKRKKSVKRQKVFASQSCLVKKV